ncbi:MAG: molybdate ABC transporter substrate-binding protein [Bacteroidetes bacterium]|nr:MAG: molybdate ABC transporter substrate-binding protein [Bacteroidota bacterium]
MRKIYAWCTVILLLGTMSLAGCVGKNKRAEDHLVLACASSLKPVIEHISLRFEEQNGVQIDTRYASSGTLFAQIRAGAPYDVFLSADTMYPNELYRLGKGEQPRIYARGSLVAWTCREAYFGKHPDWRTEPSLAIANPGTAPYGRAAASFLNHQGRKSMEQVRKPMSISQLNQVIRSKAVVWGITSRSSVRTGGEGYWFSLDLRKYPPIKHAASVLSTKGAQGETAKRWMEFLLSTEVQKEFQKYGYPSMEGKES